MAEPHASMAAGAIAGAGLSAAGGFLFEFPHLDAMLVGLSVSVLISFLLDSINNMKKSAASGFFSSLVSGYGSPAMSVYVAANVHGLNASTEALRMPMAILIATLVTIIIPIIPLLIPSVTERLKSLIGGGKQ